MNAEVISIGDEMTSGARLDTNSQWLSERLGELGVAVMYHTTVGDDLATNVRVFREAASRVEIIVSSGGLGPTADDLTREALAAVTRKPLVRDEASLAHIQGLFARRGRPMPERNLVQAMFPEGARPIPNPHGTAPGIEIDLPRGDGLSPPAKLFALPGVPAEMKEMWTASVAPAIAQRIASSSGDRRRYIRRRVVKCFGVGESDLEAMLPDIVRRGREPQVGITVSQATIALRIAAIGASEAVCEEQIETTLATIRQSLGDLIFGEGDDELPQAIARMLSDSRSTLATASGSGQLDDWLSLASPLRYLGGVCANSPSSLARVLDLGDELGKELALSGEELAKAAANAIRRRFGADYGLALCPFPEEIPDPPRLAGAIADERGTSVFFAPFAGHPEILRPRAIKHALNVLRLAMKAKASSP